SALWSSIFERVWHWYEKHRTNKIPRIRDNQTTLSPAEPQLPLWDDAAPEKSTARHLRADELPNLALSRSAFGIDRSETSNAAPPRKEISNQAAGKLIAEIAAEFTSAYRQSPKAGEPFLASCAPNRQPFR